MPSGPALPPAPSTMRPSCTATAALNAPPSSSRMNETSLSAQPRRVSLLANAERRRAELVRRAQVHAIDLAVRGNRREMDHARREHHRQLGLDHRRRERAKPADAALLARRREICEPQRAIVRCGDGDERKSVARRAGDEICAEIAEHLRERRRDPRAPPPSGTSGRARARRHRARTHRC